MNTVGDVAKRMSLRDYPKYTQEQFEAARKKVIARYSICNPDCPICGGIGYVKNDADKVVPCPNVDLFEMYSGRSGIDLAERDLNWSHIKNWNGIYSAVDAIREALERRHGWVYVWGPNGIGKTTLLKTAVALTLHGRQPAAYVRMAQIIDHLRGAFDVENASEASQNRLDWWADLPVLAIDEFDRVKETEYATERRFLLMDRRYEQAIREQDSVTLIASNKAPDHLEGYLTDRIYDGRFKVIRLHGESVRPGMGEA